MIDILLPFYGDPALMRAAVLSVLNQDDAEWRLTVVDDAFPDIAAGRWIQDLGDPRIAYHRNAHTLGVSGNMRRCMEMASSTHFVMMGCDDLMHRDYVSTMKSAALRYPDAAIIQPLVRVIDESGHTTRPLVDRVKSVLAPSGLPRELSGDALAASLLVGNWLYFPAIAWNRDKVGHHAFRRDMETVFDLDLEMNLIIEGATLVLLDHEAFSYRRHASSVSSMTARDTARFEEESRLFNELVPRLVQMGWSKAARAAQWHLTSRLHAATLLPGALRSGDTGTARLLARHVVGRSGELL